MVQACLREWTDGRAVTNKQRAKERKAKTREREKRSLAVPIIPDERMNRQQQQQQQPHHDNVLVQLREEGGSENQGAALILGE